MSEAAQPPAGLPAQADPATAVMVRGSNRFGAAGPVLERLRGFAAQPAVARSLPVLGLIGLVGAALLIWMAVSSPPSRDLFTGLGEADKGTVAQALDTAGIAYEIDAATGALTVAEGDYHRARMLLAGQGLPRGAADGNDMISSLPLGSSRAVEGERLRAAREADLARSIEAIDAVESARVHLALEPPSVFLRERARRGASVVLRLAPGRVLGAEQVQAIVHLVSSSVPGLAPDAVSVVDQSGGLLSSGSGEGAATDARAAAQARVEERYRQALNTLLTPLVGAGNFTAEVNATLDLAETQATRESFPQGSNALRSEEGSWTSAGPEQRAGGVPGALANQAPPASEVAAAPDQMLAPNVPPGAPGEGAAPTRTAENYTRNFAVGREVSVSRRAPGQVQRLSVAVALRQGAGARLTPQQLAEMEALIKGAVGFDAQRGDQVVVSERNFAAITDPAASTPWWQESWVAPLARNLTGLAIALIIVFGVARPVLSRFFPGVARKAKKSERGEEGANAAPELAAVGQEALEQAAEPQIEIQPSPADITLSMIESAPSYEARAVLIRNFVRQDPARAALVVRDLLRADNADGSDKNG